MNRSSRTLCAAATAALLLSACGGSERAADAAPTRAGQSSDALPPPPPGGAAAGNVPAGSTAAGGDTAAAGPAAAEAGREDVVPRSLATLPPPGSPPGTPPIVGESPEVVRSEGEGSQDAVALLRRVEQASAAIRSMEADFVQSLDVPLLDQKQESTGRLYQRRPDRFLMRFTRPAGDIMVADGEHFWIYYPSSDRTQVIRTSVGEAGAVDLQRQFVGDATRRFVPTIAGSETVDGHDTWRLTLVPRTRSPYRILKLWVDKDNLLVRRFEMTEENESVRRVELRNIRTNVSLSDDLFSFTPPAGTQVFDQ